MIREYAIYLREELSKYNESKGNVYHRLTQFINEGRMKDGISKRSSDKTKIAVLEEMGRNISFFLMNQHKLFGKDKELIFDGCLLLTYQEFSVPLNRDNKLNKLGI